MNNKIIDGVSCASYLRDEVSRKTKSLLEKYNLSPTLAVIIVGSDPASQVYVKNKGKFATECGFQSIQIELPETTTQDELLQKIGELNQDASINGILVQLPLPKRISKERVLTAISPIKDVDGFHPHNVGLLFAGQFDFNKNLIPCTPKGCLMLIKTALGNDLVGKKCVVVGSSNIVGRPMLALLLKEQCTVTITHSKTKDLKKELETAEIIIIAIGKAGFLKADMVPSGAVIIDVGINRIKGAEGKAKLVGDACFDELLDKVHSITPVPGGVGPMTIACLLENTLIASCMQNNVNYLLL